MADVTEVAADDASVSLPLSIVVTSVLSMARVVVVVVVVAAAGVVVMAGQPV